MEKQKGMGSWTISDELWEEIKEYIPQKQRESPANIIRKPQDKDGQGYPPDKYWRASSMFCGPGASGKLFCGNMGAGAVFTGIFKNGKRRVSLKKYGYWV